MNKYENFGTTFGTDDEDDEIVIDFDNYISNIDPKSKKFISLNKKSNLLQNFANFFGVLSESVHTNPQISDAIERSLSTNQPLTLQSFNSVRGAENVHIYLWLLFDVGWMIGNIPMALTFGIASIGWVAVLAYQAVRVKNTLETYMSMINFMWIFANVIWMFGDLINGASKYAFCAGIVMSLAATLWCVQRFWLTKCTNWIREDDVTLYRFKYSELTPPKMYGKTISWKQFEHMFLISWMLLDIGWALDLKPLWICGVTWSSIMSIWLFVACLMAPYMIIDTTHYLVQMLWLAGNIYWSYVELWTNMLDVPVPLAKNGASTPRWVCAWVLLASFIFIIAVHYVWLIMSMFDYIPAFVPIQLVPIKRTPNIPTQVGKQYLDAHPMETFEEKTIINPMVNSSSTIISTA